MASVNLKTRYTDVDYAWRPESYWEPATNPLAVLLTNVKGAKRREMIRKHFEEILEGRIGIAQDRGNEDMV